MLGQRLGFAQPVVTVQTRCVAPVSVSVSRMPGRSLTARSSSESTPDHGEHGRDGLAAQTDAGLRTSNGRTRCTSLTKVLSSVFTCARQAPEIWRLCPPSGEAFPLIGGTARGRHRFPEAS